MRKLLEFFFFFIFWRQGQEIKERLWLALSLFFLYLFKLQICRCQGTRTIICDYSIGIMLFPVYHHNHEAKGLRVSTASSGSDTSQADQHQRHWMQASRSRKRMGGGWCDGLSQSRIITWKPTFTATAMSVLQPINMLLKWCVTEAIYFREEDDGREGQTIKKGLSCWGTRLCGCKVYTDAWSLWWWSKRYMMSREMY